MLSQPIFLIGQLKIVISLICCIILLFLTLTIIQRLRKNHKSKRKEIYQKLIDNVLFKLLFDDINSKQQLFEYKMIKKKNKLFTKLLIKSVTSMHINYTGDPKLKLEIFFEESGLADYALKKLNSSNNVNVVEGIRNLSEMNYSKANKKFRQLLHHPSYWVQKEALVGIVSIKGIEGLITISHTNLYLDDWTQSNILYELQQLNQPTVQQLNRLSNTENESLILLIMRIVDYFNMSFDKTIIKRLVNKSVNPLTLSKIKQFEFKSIDSYD